MNQSDQEYNTQKLRQSGTYCYASKIVLVSLFLLSAF